MVGNNTLALIAVDGGHGIANLIGGINDIIIHGKYIP
jgi:hypothetical protein